MFGPKQETHAEKKRREVEEERKRFKKLTEEHETKSPCAAVVYNALEIGVDIGLPDETVKNCGAVIQGLKNQSINFVKFTANEPNCEKAVTMFAQFSKCLFTYGALQPAMNSFQHVNSKEAAVTKQTTSAIATVANVLSIYSSNMEKCKQVLSSTQKNDSNTLAGQADKLAVESRKMADYLSRFSKLYEQCRLKGTPASRKEATLLLEVIKEQGEAMNNSPTNKI